LLINFYSRIYFYNININMSTRSQRLRTGNNKCGIANFENCRYRNGLYDVTRQPAGDGFVQSNSRPRLVQNSQQYLEIQVRFQYATRQQSSNVLLQKGAATVGAQRIRGLNDNTFTWHQQSDRVQAHGVGRAAGVDIKHNSYDRYLRRRTAAAIQEGCPQTLGNRAPLGQCIVENNKYQKVNSIRFRCCPASC
jgi:hypothetical protein